MHLGLPAGLVAVAAAAALSLGSASDGAAMARPVIRPPANARFDYQLGGAYPPAGAVRIVDRDRTGHPVPGRYSICYVNAFQTQAAETAWWEANHPSLLLSKSGHHVVDGDWNEVLLDVSTAAKRQALLAIVGSWIDGCSAAGFQGVEADNLDSYSRSQGMLTLAMDKAFAALLIARSHADGLAIAQKNTPELGTTGRKMGFDFAIAEECNVYDECDAYTGAYGNEVFEIEYPDNGGAANFLTACASRGAQVSITYRDRDVVPAGAAGYTYQSC